MFSGLEKDPKKVDGDGGVRKGERPGRGRKKGPPLPGRGDIFF